MDNQHVTPSILKTLRSNTLSKINQGKRLTHAFNVDFSDIKEGLTGTFMVHKPTQIERLQIGVNRSILLGGNIEVDTITGNIAFMIATLDTVLDSKPDWFDVDNPDLDYEIMLSVFNEYDDWVNSFRKTATASVPKGDSKDK